MNEPMSAIIRFSDGAVLQVSETADSIDILIDEADSREDQFIEVTGKDGELQRVNIDMIQRYRNKPKRAPKSERTKGRSA